MSVYMCVSVVHDALRAHPSQDAFPPRTQTSRASYEDVGTEDE